MHSHLIDFVLKYKGTLISDEVILNRCISSSPSQDSGHVWIKVSDVILFSIQSVGIEGVPILVQSLVTDLSLQNGGLAGVLRLLLGVSFSVENCHDLFGLILSFLQLFGKL